MALRPYQIHAIRKIRQKRHSMKEDSFGMRQVQERPLPVLSQRNY